MAWIEVARAAASRGIKSSQIHSVRLSGGIPIWMDKRGNKWFVDDASQGFLLHLKSKKKREISAKSGVVRAKRKERLEETKINALAMDETERLQELSIQADLAKPIVSLRLETYKIESQKLKLELQAGDLISRHLADFLFTGYLDRLNRELLQYRNKLENTFKQILIDVMIRTKEGEEVDEEKTAREMTKHIERETEDIIKNVKENQIRELQRWAKEEGIDL